MKKSLAFFLIFIALGAGCIKDKPDPIGDSYLKGNDYATISTEIINWLNHRYSTDYNKKKKFIYNALRFDSELTLIDTYEPIILETSTSLDVPVEYYVFIFKDVEERIFHAHVQSLDGERYRVLTFSLAVDHRPNNDPIILSTWPAQEIQDDATIHDATLVIVPAAFTSKQLYYQYGDDIETARFVNVDNGISYQGINSLPLQE